MDTDSIRMIYGRNTKENAVERRMHNIRSFAELSRVGLKYLETERCLLLYQTQVGERIFIQYPGKETVSNSPEKVRPWDFRPKLQLPTGEFMKDLSFPDIWDDLSSMHNADSEVLSILAALFFRMAFMEGYIETRAVYPYVDFDYPARTQRGSGSIEFSWLRPQLPTTLIEEIQRKIGLIRGVSLEAYLLYNDLLVQNEDCKYYYRDVVIKDTKWNSKVGRCNTLLSHISVVEYLQGKITFSEIMTRFQRGMGVAPVTVGRVPEITNNIITHA